MWVARKCLLSSLWDSLRESRNSCHGDMIHQVNYTRHTWPIHQKGPFVEQGKRNLTKLQSDPSIEGQNINLPKLQTKWEIDILYSAGWDQPRVLKCTPDTSELTSILHEPSCHIWGLWCASYISYVEEHASEATGIVNTFESAIPTEYHTKDDSGLE